MTEQATVPQPGTTTPRRRGPGRSSTRTSRTLPSYEAGSVEVPYVIQGSSEVITHDTWWEEHSHPTHELLWNERGASTATVGPRTWTVTPSIGLWVPAGVRHSGWTPAGTWQRAAQLNTRTVRSISETPVAVDLTPLLTLLLDRLDSDLGEASRATTEAMVLDVLVPAPTELLLQSPTSELLAPVVETVLADPADPTTLAGWAARLGVSTRTVTRTFLAETGLGFSQWVATARTQHAIALLARGEEIEDVALLVGYGSASAFGTAFRRVTGVSPGRFRAR